MRAIDADALKDRLQSIAYDDWNQGVTTLLADAYRECADMVDEQPTIESERKRGCWVGIDDEPCETYECDVCGAVYDTVGNTWDLPNYCPNCGAKMRGEQNEAD